MEIVYSMGVGSGVGVGAGVGVAVGSGVGEGVGEGVGVGAAVGSGVGAGTRTSSGRAAQRGESAALVSSTASRSTAKILAMRIDVLDMISSGNQTFSTKLPMISSSTSGMTARLSTGMNSCTPW